MTGPGRWLLALAALVLTGGVSVALDGLAPLGRAALRAGLPGLAAPLLRDPLWQGVALYRADDYGAAVAALRAAGPRGYFDRGNALARAGRYPEAVEVYDAALYDRPRDADARANRALVLALISVVGEAQAATGRSEPDGAPPEPQFQEHQETYYQPILTNQEQGRRHFEDQAMAATPQWLATLADEPGQYLELRLRSEQERRFADGIGLPPPEDPR